MIRLVMWINKGPTDFDTRVQFTDWDEETTVAGQVAQLTAGADVVVATGRCARCLTASTIRCTC